MERVSSHTTWLIKWLPPVLGAAAVTEATLRPSVPLYAALLLALVFFVLTGFGMAIKEAELGPDSIRIKGYFRTCTVPRAHLVGVQGTRFNYRGTILLTFSEATPWGTRIRIVPPLENFQYAFDTLDAIARGNTRA
jgi:hypothetical protein